MARGFAFVATLLAAGSMATPAVAMDGSGFLAAVVMATPAVDDLPIIMSCPPTLDVLPDYLKEAADAFSTVVIEEIWQKTSLPVRKSKFYGAFVLIISSSSTPSTRCLLDGVVMPIPHRSTEPGRQRDRREMT